ncbi:MAG: arylesterase [Acidobacteria bacterium]|nr:arylesterase [Acidobacteriota bacterium]
MYVLIALWFLQTADSAPQRVVILGDSLTAGYGLSPDLAYPALLQKKVDAEGLAVTIVNAGVSGDTSAGGLRRLNWLLKAPIDVFVLALGANDGLRGLPVSETETNLKAMIEKVRAANPKVKVLLMGMKVPPNMGESYSQSFEAIFPQVAQSEQVKLLPFLLDKVAGDETLNQADGIHPNQAGHEIVAQTVWTALNPLLKKEKGR